MQCAGVAAGAVCMRGAPRGECSAGLLGTVSFNPGVMGRFRAPPLGRLSYLGACEVLSVRANSTLAALGAARPNGWRKAAKAAEQPKAAPGAMAPKAATALVAAAPVAPPAMAGRLRGASGIAGGTAAAAAAGAGGGVGGSGGSGVDDDAGVGGGAMAGGGSVARLGSAVPTAMTFAVGLAVCLAGGLALHWLRRARRGGASKDV